MPYAPSLSPRLPRARWPRAALAVALGAVLAGAGAPVGYAQTPPGSATAVQAPPAVLGRVEAALGAGDADALGALAADRVLVSVSGNSRVYSRAQATLVLARFFEETPPRRFRFEHRMPSGTDAYFASGRYDHAGGRMTVLVRFGRAGTTWEVRELRAEAGGLE